jgi:hypothetical protein
MTLVWKVYYADGATFSSDDGGWGDAPARGVIAVTVPDPDVGREVMSGTDYYLWWPGAAGPWSVDKAGLWDFLYEVGSPLAGMPLDNEHFDRLVGLGVKFGRSMDTRAFRARLAAIVVDPDLPPKSALSVREVLR